MPGRHGVQSLAAVCRASVPPGHIWHWEQPEELQNLPSAHGAHEVELCCDEKKPGEQLVQLSSPVLLLNEPAGQG